LHAPAAAVLARHLCDIPDLDFPSRSRADLLGAIVVAAHPDAFPVPSNKAQALGMMYVLEGSTLGGRFILQRLSELGSDVSQLSFLDPYGAETGPRWRSFLRVLERETSGDDTLIADACRGARVAFAHAERVLCGPPA
jgi:heme oxygenase